MYWKVGEFLGRKTDYVAYDDIYMTFLEKYRRHF